MTNLIMITGATGFVGQHLVQYLCENKNYALRIAARSKALEFDSCVDIHSINCITADMDWANVLNGCNTVIHMAARVHFMQENAADPLHEFRKINVDGTLNLARQAIKQGIKRFIFISTIKVNGEATDKTIPFKADDTPNPEDPYAVSKYEAEQGLMALSAETGLEVVIIRPPLVYGPGVKGNFQSMMKWLARGIPLPLGRVNNKRSFVSVDNLVHFIILCIDHPSAANEVFLVSDGEDLSTTELLTKLGDALDKPARLLSVPFAMLNTAATLVGKKDMLQRLGGSLQVDISKARDLLGWDPKVKVDDALRNTVTHYFDIG